MFDALYRALRPRTAHESRFVAEKDSTSKLRCEPKCKEVAIGRGFTCIAKIT
jgi:hypothetical protein